MRKRQLNNEPELLEALNDLYVIRRNRYLKQVNGNTFTMIAGKRVQNKRGGAFKTRPLVDTMITEHLNGKASYGVFATDETKFLLFDFDFADDWNACKWHYYKVRDAILQTGISDDYIYTVFSGSKGLHLTLYFDTPIKVQTAYSYYENVLGLAELSHMKRQIEFRPTATQGVKLPLGWHTKTRKRVVFVENHNVENPFPISHILKVNKLTASDFDGLDKPEPRREPEPMTDQEVLERAKAELFSKTKLLDIYALGTNEEYTVDYYNKLLTEGLRVKGTRHKVTYQLALYLKTHYGVSENEATAQLVAWLQEQDPTMYSTPLQEALTDTLEIVKHIYSKNIDLQIPVTELTVTISELRTILTATKLNGKHFTPKQKTVLFALLMHGKRYATQEGSFYMTYEQITEITGMKNRSEMKAIIEEFADVGLVVIHRSDTRQEGSHKHLPNIYEVLFKAKENTVTDSTPHTENDSVSKVTEYTSETLTKLVQQHFTDKELRKLIPKGQIKHFTA